MSVRQRQQDPSFIKRRSGARTSDIESLIAADYGDDEVPSSRTYTKHIDDVPLAFTQNIPHSLDEPKTVREGRRMISS